MTDTTVGDAPDLGSALHMASNGAPARSVAIDTAKYQAYLDDPSLTDDQKEAIVGALYSIMMAFVDLGFGVHPMQEVCGQLDGALDDAGEEDSNDPKPVHETLTDAFNHESRLE